MKDSNNSSICLIILYFGKLPNYFEFWLSSCKYNKSINFLLFTDDKTKFDFPDNVKVIYTTFEDIKNCIQSKFDFEIALDRPYKLCDYKPTYGYIFSDYLSKFDFWGHCDLDVIFGNLRKFLPEDVLEKYDKIYRAAHFSLYKNNERVNKSFMEFKDKNNEAIYKNVYSSNESFFFDENGKNNDGILKFFDKNGLSMYANKENIADISIKYNNLLMLYNVNKMHPSIFEYNNNDNQSKLYAYIKIKGEIHKTEYMYVHLQKRKMEILTKNTNRFLIIPNKFIDELDVIQNFKKLKKKITIFRKDYIKAECIKKMKKIGKFNINKQNLKNNKIIMFMYNSFRKILTLISPKTTSKLNYKMTFGENVNLKNPKGFNEKLMYIRIYNYDKNPLVWKCSDKYELREYALSCGLTEENFPKLYGVYNNAKEIDFSKFPDKFVLKCSHGCGFNFICTDKNKIDENKVRKLLNKWKRENFGLISAETQYLHSKRYIYCEEYIENEKNEFPMDYKIYCFNGKAKLVLVCSERKEKTRLNFFDLNWNELMIGKPDYRSNKELKKPERLEEMINLAEKLSIPFPFVRIDFYEYKGNVILGEMTFTPAANCAQYYTKDGNLFLGDMLEIE